jgi:hypothetical protein
MWRVLFYFDKQCTTTQGIIKTRWGGHLTTT